MTIPIRRSQFFAPTPRPRRFRQTKMALFEVHDRVKALVVRCQSAGLEPIEVWLGPAEAKAVAEGLQSDPGMYGPYDAARGLEGHKFASLTIRLSKSPGIRVGTTVE